eukprot:jgi/Orpsp1_1/1186946/evm.model.d7180000054311.2
MTLLQYDNCGITLQNSIKFIGNENGSIFDYKGNHNKELLFLYSRSNGVSVTFENIIFENYSLYIIPSDSFSVIIFNIFSLNFNALFKNCIFRNNNGRLIHIGITMNYEPSENNKFTFSNCTF